MDPDVELDLRTLERVLDQLAASRMGKLLLACHRESLETVRDTLNHADAVAFTALCGLSYRLGATAVIPLISLRLKA